MNPDQIKQSLQSQDLVEQLQNECNDFIYEVQKVMNKKGLEFNYDDAKTIWIFQKLAELQMSIKTSQL